MLILLFLHLYFPVKKSHLYEAFRSNILQAECDYWSLGVVAYEMVFGQTPFSADQLTTTYYNIMNYKTTLKFPEGSGVSQSYCEMVRGLLDDATSRLGHEQLLKHPFFSSVNWNTLREG